ncbi:tetratricopeptide repeat-containing glycosyltransferase family protein [Leptothrix discophora]|uniref:Tetratricopeptide repeat-containing glycosyltransferase family protein n=1 Tax=Leptothrix discophora TaxID=89 RepID=A0ABT9G6W9_LEPDI|nr:tetratricopeptide repeat-containing glycosyltransferase family protein [Leptothrix discophora]MDP4302219.1 tetratricopeptide repeat-containing glycosyltransferase family protein [Leptothrix discophora]
MQALKRLAGLFGLARTTAQATSAPHGDGSQAAVNPEMARPVPHEDLAQLESCSGHAALSQARASELADALAACRIRHEDLRDSALLRLFDAALLRLQGDLDAAAELADTLLAAPDVDPSRVHLELALTARARHDLPGATESLTVAVSLDPDFGVAWLRLGEVLGRLDRLDEAGSALSEAVRCLDGEAKAEALHLQGEILRMRRRHLEAGAAFDACLAIAPERRQTLIARGHVHLMAEEEGQALACYEAALQQAPHLAPEVQLNIGSIRQNMGNLEGAREMYQRLLDQRPGDHAARWYLCQLDLLQGRWASGWANYSSRYRAGALPYRPMPYASWDGRPLPDETLLVLADQGLGDEIMFASCLPDLQRRAPHAIVECEPRLRALFERSFPGLRFVATQRENSTDWLAGLPTPTWQVSAGELPSFFRLSDSDFPDHCGYLKADPARVAAWRERLKASSGGQRVVGISWRGGLVGTRTRARSIDVAEWGDILSCPGVHFVNLQYGDCTSDLANLQARHGVTIEHHPEVIADYDETAAMVCAMDLVVSVCTSIIHLTGALGQPVWVLTPHSPGWRYTADRDRLPWYPSSRIFRQPQAGDWVAACRELSAALREMTRNVSPHPASGTETPSES